MRTEAHKRRHTNTYKYIIHVQMRAYTETCTLTHTYTSVHKCIRAHTLTREQAYINVNMRPYTLMCLHKHPNTYTTICLHVWNYGYTYTCVNTRCMPTCTHNCVNIMQTYVCIYTYAYVHKCTHVNGYLCVCMCI